MKTLFALLISISTLYAQAETPIQYVQAAMKVYYVEDNSPLADLDITSAKTYVDLIEQTITLTINVKMPNCLADMACITLMPEPVKIKLDLIEVVEDACGSVTYTAMSAMSPSDSLIETLIFSDNTQNTCPTTFPLPEFQATYQTLSPRAQVETNAVFVSMEPDFREYDNKVILPVEPLESF